MADALTVKRWLRVLGAELDRRRYTIRKLDRYYDGDHDAPEHIKQVKLEPEYKLLLKQSITNWPQLIVSAVEERCIPQGIRFGGELDQQAWDVWQRNYLDADCQTLHTSAFTDGRAGAVVWADPKNDGKALVTYEHASNLIVAYEPGSRRRRAAALRRWQDDDETWHATLYLPDGLYKFSGPKGAAPPSIEAWKPREVAGEDWPLDNPLKVVTAVEFAVNRSLRPCRGPFVHARGEFEGVLPVIDRINTTIFAELLAQAYASFPVRALLGEPIKWLKDAEGELVRDADGKPTALPPFKKLAVDRFLQIENKDAKIQQLEGSDLDNYIKAAESHIRHLAAVTKTPPQYLLGELVNISADGMKVAESNLLSKVRSHMRVLGEDHEEVTRIGLMVEGRDAGSVVDAELLWKNPEIRSDAQLADATLKLKDVLPWRMQMEYLGYSDKEIARAEELRGDDVFAAVASGTGGTAADAADLKAKADAMGALIRSGVEPKEAAQTVGLGELAFTGAVPVSLRLPTAEAGALEDA